MITSFDFLLVNRLGLVRLAASLCAMTFILGSMGACGGGDEDMFDGIGEIEFVDEPTATPAPVERGDVIGEFLQDTALLLPDMEYLDMQAFYLDELQRVARDLSSYVGQGQSEASGLEWVVTVHRMVLEWDALQSLLVEQPVSSQHREQYGDIYVGMIESYYRIAFGVDRVLGAAVILGPTGRTADEMSFEERRRYLMLLNQAEYFAEIADEKLSEMKTSGRFCIICAPFQISSAGLGPAVTGRSKR